MDRQSTVSSAPARWRKYLSRAGRLLVFVLLLVGALVLFLNQVGLPGFARAKIEAQLRAQGADLEFGRIRWRGLWTWVAENVRWRRGGGTNSPDLAIPEAELGLNPKSLLRFKLEPVAFSVRQGRLTIPFTYSNSPPAHLPLDDINLVLHSLPDSRWQLTQFTARCLNATLHVTGSVTNAAAFTKRKPSESSEPLDSPWPRRLHQLATELQRTRLDAASILRLEFHGDARDWSVFRAKLDLRARKASTPTANAEDIHLALAVSPEEGPAKELTARLTFETGLFRSETGRFERGLFTGQLGAAPTNLTQINGNWRCELAKPQTPWGGAEKLNFSATVKPSSGRTNDSAVTLSLVANGIRTRWGGADSATLTSNLDHTAGRIESLEGSWQLDTARLNSQWGNTESARFSGELRRSNSDPSQRKLDGRWSWRQAIDQLALDWQGQIGRVTSPVLEVEGVDSAGAWRAPVLSVQKFHAQLYGGQLDLAASINVTNREAKAKLDFDFDVHRIAPLLTTNTQGWLRQFRWEKPPQVTAEAQMILPDWTNREPRRYRDAARAARLSGEFQSGPGAFRGVEVRGARSHFALSNSVWRLPDLDVRRVEGHANLDGTENTGTHDYLWKFRSEIDPEALRPMLQPAQWRVLDLFKFSRPPVVEGQFQGQWRRPDLAGVAVSAAATNFTFRGEAFDEFRSGIQYTNRLLSFVDAEVRRGSQRATASKAVFDADAGVVHLTNAVSSMEPDFVGRVIGPEVRAAIAPYHFQEPPNVIVNGTVPAVADAPADAEFNVVGKRFNYWRFNLPDVSAIVRWRGNSVTISNLQGSFYKGRLKWDGKFELGGQAPTRYEFRGQVARSDLRSLISDLTLTNTPLEGVLDGSLVITSADTGDWRSWRGYGDAQLHDGHIWSVPVFGVFSPILNNLIPGIGPSRITSANATFTIDKGLIRTSDLEMRAPALRLQYVGSVDLNGRVDARVQAEILRDALGVVGRTVSLALWPVTKVFESKVTGTLNNPRSELLYFPKFLTWPFRPLRTLKEVILPDRSPAAQPSGRKPEPSKPTPKPPGE